VSADAPERPPLLVLTSTYPRGRRDNVPSFVHDLCRRLSPAFRVVVLAPHSPGAAETESLDGVTIVRFRYAPERLERLAYGGGMLANLRRSPAGWLLVPFFLVSQYRLASRLIRQNQIRMVHGHWLLPQGIVAAMLVIRYRSQLRVLLTAHGSDMLRLDSGLAARLRRWVIGHATAVTVVSEGMKRRADLENPGSVPTHVMPMGTDLTDAFRPDANTRRDTARLLFVGRLSPEKGVNHLISALPAVCARYPRARLAITGSGPEERMLRELAARLGVADRIDFLGFVSRDRLPELYCKATMLILPSLSEGFGLVLVEALGCECPIVASDLPGTREIVQPGETGHLVPAGDVAALSEAIMEILGNPDQARAAARLGRSRCLEKFDWTSVANNYRALITNLLQHGA
jgi:glycosyltransferase involved in cell wall biosynthesis